MSTRAVKGLPEGPYVICDDGVRAELSIVDKARRSLAGGARVVQLRMKATPPREGLAAVREVVALCRGVGAVCLVNDRVDLALMAGADGVHVGDEDLPVEDARRLLGPRATIGRTARTLAEVEAAAAAGADYAGVGPIFGSTTKQVDHPLLGIEGLRPICADAPIPVVAISGIGLANIAQVAEAGAHGAAVASDLLLAPDIEARAALLVESFAEGARRRSIRRTP